MTLKQWMQLLLVCLCCHFELQPVTCEPEWMSPRFPCEVTGNTSSKVQFNCKERHLRGVPHGITANATELILSDNYIKNISAGSFSNLLNLTRLDLTKANTKEPVMIFGNAFKGLMKLRELRLGGNFLDTIPSNLPLSLEILQLDANRITSLDHRSLVGLTNVTHLWLSKNCYFLNPCGKYSTVTDNSLVVLRKLQALDLSFNNLTQVPKGLPQSLRVLSLASNKIQYISDDDLSGLPNLQVLKIEGNCPICENAPYSCVPCQNVSMRLHPNAFHSLTELEVLNMGGNSLRQVNPSWFERLNKLKQLLLAFNYLFTTITQEATFLRYLPKLEKIDMSFNFKRKYYPRTVNLSKDFSNLVSLRTLHMEGLVFQNLQARTLTPLYQLKNLSALNFGTNFIIHADSNIFRRLSHLKVIYLAENRLYPIPTISNPHPIQGYDQVSDISVSTVNARHPEDLSYDISHKLIKQECFDSGRVLSLSSNSLFFISQAQFKGYGDIACLNLSGNGFSAALNGTEFRLLPNLTYLDLSFNKIDLAYDNAFKELEKLQVLDLSHNAHYFTAFGVTHNLNFLNNLPALRVLNMSYNSIYTLTTKQLRSKSLAELQFRYNFLGKLWKESDGSYKMLFNSLTNLTILDISYNKIENIPHDVYEYLPGMLTKLCISHNWLSDFTWDNLKSFNQLQTLDLSFNHLTNVTVINPDFIDTLTFLDLSHNHISHLDDGFLNNVKSLHTLSLNSNKLTTVNQSTFQPRDKTPLKTIFLQRNLFQCTCDSLNFILWLEHGGMTIPGRTTRVTCDTPANQKGQVLIYFDINQCVNDSQAFLAYILTHCFVIVFMIATTAAHLFYWDVSYVLHYMRAKLNRYSSLNSPESIYDVFVTYDTSDPHVSEWVMRNLRVKLEEEGEKSLPLCLEERDWTPGVPLVENLSQSIRYSRKTLFVLTEGYVKTGVFKLAMYLAHQRLLDENVDVIMVLLLEPVLQHSHFLRLRRRLCGESVVEWPRTAAAEPWFWQNLRNVIRVDNQSMCSRTYTKGFSNS